MAGDHTAEVLALVALPLLRLGGGDGGSTTLPEPASFGFGDIAWGFVVTCFFAIPIGVSLWALLDAARRPRWAWALAERRQIVWLAVIMFGVLSVIGGLLISGWYLLRVRPAIAAAERGQL